MKKEIDFIGIGTIKSGTSFLSDLLVQHPDILWASRKEVNYFNEYELNGQENPYSQLPLSFYLDFFSEKERSEQKQGEFSPGYIHDVKAMERINKDFPDARILILCRNPVDRAFSHYLYSVNFTKIIDRGTSFEEALENHPFLLELGNYSSQIENAFRIFGKEKVLVLAFKDLITQPLQVVKRVYQFIGVDPEYSPEINKVNESKKIKNPLLDKIYSAPSSLKHFLLNKNIISKQVFERILQTSMYRQFLKMKYRAIDQNVESFTKPTLSPEIRNQLKEYYAEDIEKTSDLTGLDLSSWKE